MSHQTKRKTLLQSTGFPVIPPKFKGFSVVTNQWHFGHGWVEIDYTDDYKAEHKLTDKALLYTESGPIECEKDSMSQSTGQAINNKEIYNGDIIRVDKLSFDSSAPLPDTLNIVYYGGMYQFFKGRKPMMGLHLLYLEEGEVIGTMYENPELIDE